MGITERTKTWARRIKRDAVMLWFAYRDLRTPLAVKALCAFVVAYALSPIDPIPDLGVAVTPLIEISVGGF